MLKRFGFFALFLAFHIFIGEELYKDIKIEPDWNGLISINNSDYGTTVQVGNKLYKLPNKMTPGCYSANLKSGTFKYNNEEPNSGVH